MLPEGEAQKKKKMKENKSGMALSQVRSYSQLIRNLSLLKYLSLDWLIFSDCIQVSQEASQVVWYSHPLQNFPQFIVIHTVKGFVWHSQ